ncbi:hypothetical protein GMDG_08891, partial [Pseudogymnoascus destructans 20631-21]
MPLSSDKAAMKSLISSFNVTGSTAGQIGLAWGWYTVSPSFNPLWSGNPAGPADPDELLKVVILMTDGEFNTNYCTGVLAPGFRQWRRADQLRRHQWRSAEGIVVYTVGLELAAGGEAEEVMQSCATSPTHVYLPSSGADLSQAFAAI